MENKRCVYVGNIPYHAAEKEILEVLQEAGPVVSLELATEKETGKSKGHGFCEYRDEETAQSAIRNLNGYPIRGRELKVDIDKRNRGGRDKNPSPPQTAAFPNARPPQTMQAPNPRPISQFPPAVESALLQQVLSLPPEKLSSLSPWEQQQVIQLQRMYGSARSDMAGIICR